MIFYFSATGNTLWAAQRVAQVTGERLLSVAELIKSQHAFALEKDERVGFIYPIYGWRPPVIMREFVRKLPSPHSNHQIIFRHIIASHYALQETI